MTQNIESNSNNESLIDQILLDLAKDLEVDGTSSEQTRRYACTCAHCP